MSFQEINKPPPKQRSKTSEKVYVRPLTSADLPSAQSLCEQTRTTHLGSEQLNRLSTLSYLTLGIFTTPPLPRSDSCPPEPTYVPHSELLLGFVIATLSTHTSLPTITPDTPRHDDAGDTLVLRCVAVTSDMQRKGIGQTLMSSWLERVREAAIGKRVVSVVPTDVVSWFRKFGFVDVGPAMVRGEAEGESGRYWRQMRLEFNVGLSGSASEEDVPELRWRAGF